MQFLRESYIDVFMGLLDGPVKGDRPSRSANVTATNSQLRAYARVRGLIVLHCTRWTVQDQNFPGSEVLVGSLEPK